MSKYKYTDKHNLYHIFSKTPTYKDQVLGDVVNKSGHTVIAKQVFVDQIPWFPKCNARFVFKSEITQKAVKGVDHLCISSGAGEGTYIRNEVDYTPTIEDDEGQVVKLSERNFGRYITKFWTPITLEQGYKIFNKNGDAVLEYHKDIPLTYLTADNNTNQPSDETAARAFGEDGAAYTLFVASTDAIHHSTPSKAYDVEVVGSGNVLTENAYTAEEIETLPESGIYGYFANNFNGTIFFNKQYDNPTISFFEYIGRNLNDKIDEIDTSIDNIEESLTTFTTKTEFEELSNRVDGITSFSYVKVDELPEESAECVGKIYLVQIPSTEEDNVHEEFICVETEVDGTKTYSWELIGTTKIDLSDYALKSDIKIKTINGIIGDVTDKNVTIKYDQTYHGADMIESDGDSNTITFNPASMWEYDGDSFADVVKVENGVCYDANNNVIAVIDDGNLTKGHKDDVGMFVGNETLTSFVGDLSSLEDGSYMFMGSKNLETFVGDLGKLENGSSMFYECSNLKNVNTDLSSLIMGRWMFLGCNLTKNSIEIICDMLPTAPENDHADYIYTIDINGDDSQDTKTYVNNTASAKNWKIVFNNITYPLSE